MPRLPPHINNQQLSEPNSPEDGRFSFGDAEAERPWAQKPQAQFKMSVQYKTENQALKENLCT